MVPIRCLSLSLSFSPSLFPLSLKNVTCLERRVILLFNKRPLTLSQRQRSSPFLSQVFRVDIATTSSRGKPTTCGCTQVRRRPKLDKDARSSKCLNVVQTGLTNSTSPAHAGTPRYKNVLIKQEKRLFCCCCFLSGGAPLFRFCRRRSISRSGPSVPGMLGFL